MIDRIAQIRTALAAGPVAAGALCTGLSVTRPTLARALASMPGEIVTLGAARSTRYALRDPFRVCPTYRLPRQCSRPNRTARTAHSGQARRVCYAGLGR